MKKIHFLVDHKVETVNTYPIFQALVDILDNLKIRDQFEMNDLGTWRESDYLDHGYPKPFRSIDWLLAVAYEQRVDKSYPSLNTLNLTTNLRIYAGIKKTDYAVLITDRMIVHPIVGKTNGRTTRYQCSVLSLNFLHDNNNDSEKAIYKLALHEFGHLFGLILDTSRPHLASSHCLNHDCVMTEFNFHTQPNGYASFCETCQSELQEFAKHVKTSG